jgi:CRISPR-associated protein Cas2
MNHLISYDISNNKLRLKVAKQLKIAGCYRLQYSVFAGDLRDRPLRELVEVFERFTHLPDWDEEDSILVLPLHQYSRDQLKIFGTFPDDWDLMQGDLHTLVI